MSSNVYTATKVRKAHRRGSLNSWRTYIHKVLKQVHPDTQISAKTLEQLDEFIKILARTLAESGRVACINSSKSTVGKAEITLAVQLHLPGELAKHALGELDKAVTKFQQSKSVKDDFDSEKEYKSRSAPIRREQAAGLLFSVALAEKFIREFGASDLSVSKNSSVALAAVLEYTASEILELAGRVARDNKKVIITIRHVYLAIANDKELHKLISNLNIEFLGAGILPNIRTELLPSKEKRQKQAANRKKMAKAKGKNDKKSRKFLPGTKALLEIRKHQRSTELLLRKLPFERAIRAIADQLNINNVLQLDTIHFGGGSIEAIQHFVEKRVVNLCINAQDLAIHGNRDGVNDQDVKLAWKLTEPSIPFTQTEIEEIGENGIERLAYRAGIKRKGSGMYNMVRCYMYSLVNAILFQVLQFVKYRGVITVQIRDLQAAFQSLHINFTIPPTMGKPKIIRKTITTV
jgi:histone H3/H4